MTAYAWFEFAVITALVGWSAWTVFGRLLPGARSRLLRALGKTPQPAPSAACGSSCSACSGCVAVSPAAVRKPGEAPVRLDALR
ncbi:DUF6587 family protein [Fontimonas sp. SYSU GA230001]|uniref:DUF6587 family protein n=1 Tax=Fontimonas sp. SYSU GA230001 TaxID=3142450 RepID=UPI0032B3D601